MNRMKLLLVCIGLLLGLCGCMPKPPGSNTKIDPPEVKQIIEFVAQNMTSYTTDAYKRVFEAYKKYHPEVEIRILNGGRDDLYLEFLDVNLANNSLPEIIDISGNSYIRKFSKEGYVVDLHPYLNESTPYNKGLSSWRESWNHEVLDYMNQFAKEYDIEPTVSTYSVSVRIFYNQDLFRQAGVPLPRTNWTWGDFIHAQELLQQAGILPFAFANSRKDDLDWFWTEALLFDMLCDNKLKQAIDTNHNQAIEVNEKEQAYLTGVISGKEPFVREAYRFIKQWSSYWGEGFNSMDKSKAQAEFVQGRAAMILDGSWSHRHIKDSIDDTFQFGIVPFPVMTKVDSPLASGAFRSPELTLGHGNLAISRATVKRKNNLETVVDVLRFITSPEGQSLYSRYSWNPPSIKNAVVDDNTSAFVNQANIAIMYGSDRLIPGNEFSDLLDQLQSNTKAYLNGDWSLDEFMQEYAGMFRPEDQR